MVSRENNYAFIDSQNLNINIRSQGWILDFVKFRQYLKEKYSVQKAFIFIGYIEVNKELYFSFKRAGFICIFKPVLEYEKGQIKGNCDAELVLHAATEINNYDKAIIVSGDGDFYCLIKYLIIKEKLKTILIPNQRRYSALFKNSMFIMYLRFMNDLRDKLEYKIKKAP